RPFLLGAVFKATGNSPPAFNLYKARYLYQDVLRWTHHYGLPDFTLPDSFPGNSVKADRLGLVAQEMGKLPQFTHTLYRVVFVQGKDVADVAVLSSALDAVGIAPAEALGRAEAQDIKDLLRKNTDEAVERGSFGAPTFFVGEDMYVGNDRLMFVERALRG
ncbi:MAG TPA: 2-hydroxychromene-2-carboxylate isomerase, partial [Myxococcaceae bacterium]|nr:2-hydroxychromene-2-carboxylate isomerase [Myxococcaceae bacterium]